MAKKKNNVSTIAFKVRYLRRSRELYRRYLETKPWLKQLYVEFLGLKPGLRIVDVGCGTGDFTMRLARLIQGKCRVLGVDARGLSLRTAVSETRKAGYADRISYKKGDVYKLPVEDGYADLTACRTLLMHLKDPLGAVKEMARITKPGGLVAAVERGRMQSFFDPEDVEYSELAEEMGRAYLRGVERLEGKDFRVGDRLPYIFQKAGLEEIRAEVQPDPWMPCDLRYKLDDVKAELRFEYLVYKETRSVDRKSTIAGGVSGKRVDRFYRMYEQRLRRLLSDDTRLRRSTMLYAGGLYLVAGRRPS